MPFRDDTNAIYERNRSLERELEEAKRKIERLEGREGEPISMPSPPTVREDASTQTQRAEAYRAIFVFGACTLAMTAALLVDWKSPRMLSVTLIGGGLAILPAIVSARRGARMLLSATGDTSDMRVRHQVLLNAKLAPAVPAIGPAMCLWQAFVLFRGRLPAVIYGSSDPSRIRTDSFDAVDIGTGGRPLAWFFLLEAAYVTYLHLAVLALSV